MMQVTATGAETFFSLQGRRYVKDGRLFLNASGASLKGLFRGKRLCLTLFSEPIMAGRNAYMRLTVDGKTRRMRMPKGEKTVLLELPQGEHTFEIIKLTESANNSLAFLCAESDGDFLPVQPSGGLKIEFIGDSITTGFGVLCRETYGEYKTKEQDVTKAFPYLTARALGASFNLVAAGGWPIYKSKYAPFAIPDYYGNVDLTRNTEEWDFSAFVPDVIVVTLGTNDFSYLADLSEEERAKERAEVKHRFLAFLRRLLTQNAKMVLVYGFFPYPDLGVLTEEVARELDDPRVSTLEVKSAASLNDVCAGHPGKRTHKLASARLIKRIRSLVDLP